METKEKRRPKPGGHRCAARLELLACLRAGLEGVGEVTDPRPSLLPLPGESSRTLCPGCPENPGGRPMWNPVPTVLGQIPDLGVPTREWPMASHPQELKRHREEAGQVVTGPGTERPVEPRMALAPGWQER